MRLSEFRQAQRRIAPGPRGHWLWGSLPERRDDPIGLMTRSAEKYGHIVRYRLGPLRALQATHPDQVKQVLVDRAHLYGKGRGLSRAEPLLGHGLLLSEGEFWKRQRRLAQPAFHRDRLAKLVEPMVDAAQNALKRWRSLPDGSRVDISQEMMRLTLEIVGRTLFSTDVSGAADAVGQALTDALHETNVRLTTVNPLRRFLPTRANRRFRSAVATLDAVVFGMIGARRQPNSEEKNDLLSMLMAVRDQDTGEVMSDRQLRDEAMTIFLAGHETTANGMSWMWHLLSQNPDVEARLHAELQSVLGGRAPTLEDIPRLPYTMRVFEETMRLYPPAWVIGRQAMADDELAGYPVPKGTLVFVSPYLTHRHPDFWEEPLKFDPDRFTLQRSVNRPKLAYFPFGAGQRMCIGNNFAMLEAQLLIATLAQHFRFSAAPGAPIEMEPLITLRPRAPMPMLLRPRSPG